MTASRRPWPILLLLAAGACGGSESPTAPTGPAGSVLPSTPGRHDVSFTAAGVTAGGILYRPTGTEPRPALIVLHGWQSPGTNGAATSHRSASSVASAFARR